MLMTQVLEYLKFLLKSSNQYGIHSPFVYDLTINCFYRKTDSRLWSSFLRIKHQLLDNKKNIRVTDFGAGSKVFKNKKRPVYKIAKIAGISDRKAKLLIRLVGYLKPKTVLELGTSLGLGTIAIKIGSIDTSITSIEGCPETSIIAQKIVTKNELKNITLIVGNFNKMLPKVTQNNQYELIYFDGNHNKKATLAYFEICLQTINNNSVWIFDDIYWSKDMKEAWAEIKKHPKVTVTIDVFYWGIVFFRKKQAKEHFKIRL